MKVSESRCNGVAALLTLADRQEVNFYPSTHGPILPVERAFVAEAPPLLGRNAAVRKFFDLRPQRRLRETIRLDRETLFARIGRFRTRCRATQTNLISDL